MMKIEKGQPGYVKARKVKYLIWTIAEFGVVIAIFVLGYMQTGTRMNLFTIVAIVGCLPAAKMLVELLTMAPHKSIEPDKYKEIEEKAPLVTRVYDMVITSRDKVMPVDAIVISGHVVCGYASSPRTDETLLAKHIKDMLKASHYDKMTVKIFHDYVAFLSRAEGMNNIASIEKADTRKKEREIRNIILNLSM